MSPTCSFEEGTANSVHGDEKGSALSDVASSRRYNSHRSGWTSSEDEADAMDEDGECLFLHLILNLSVSVVHLLARLYYHARISYFVFLISF